VPSRSRPLVRQDAQQLLIPVEDVPVKRERERRRRSSSVGRKGREERERAHARG
jgi:hypothetical protein